MDSQNNPVEGATVKLAVWDTKKDNFPTKIIETTKTDRNGRFSVNIGGEKPETKLWLGIEREGFKITILRFTPLLIQKNSEVFKNYRVILEKQ